MRYRIETERENLFDVNMIISMRVRLNDQIPFDPLKNAFHKTTDLYEILNSKVVIEDNGDAYYVDCDHPKSGFYRSELSFTELINANEKIRFKIEEGEYIRGYLASDGLVFLMHHLGGDGKSLLFFIESFLSVLEGSVPEKVPFGRLSVSDLPEESNLPFLYRLFVMTWNRKWAKQRKAFSFQDMDRAYDEFWKDHETETVLDVYEKSELEKMLSNCKEDGCSLTSYLISEFISDMPFKADVGLAVDGRLDDNRLMGNYATGIHVKYRYDSGRSTGENARLFNDIMKRKLSDMRVRYSALQIMGRLDPTLVDALSLESAGTFHTRLTSRFAEIMNYGNKKKDLSITNLMRADIRTRYGDIMITDIAFVPPVVSYGKNLVGIITVNDCMIISRHSYKRK